MRLSDKEALTLALYHRIKKFGLSSKRTVEKAMEIKKKYNLSNEEFEKLAERFYNEFIERKIEIPINTPVREVWLIVKITKETKICQVIDEASDFEEARDKLKRYSEGFELRGEQVVAIRCLR